ncbi:MAG: hypothetical protein COB69_01760 [Phycisphaera sp.]|nr:MAG: hypothetical protein COB69_01760 [Phycisphaera sp.]
MSTSDRKPSPHLCENAEQALDALVESGWAIERIPAEHRDCAHQLMSMLDSACDTASESDPNRLESLMREVLERLPTDTKLHDDSADALDLWCQSGYQASAVPKSLRGQAETHEGFARLISLAVETQDVQASDALVDSTISAILNMQAAEVPRDFTFNLKFRMMDLASIAAILLVGVSVVMPMISSMRYESIRKHNETNFAVSSVGFGSYAMDHTGSLPVYTPSGELISEALSPSLRWWMVGLDPTQSNSANLFTLVRFGYASLDSLTSPGNLNAGFPVAEGAVDWDNFEQVSYSFRVKKRGANRANWATRGKVVMADRSPVTLKAFKRLPIDPFENSPNHAGRGQHVLHGDGSVEWLNTPWLARNDHIFLPEFIEVLINPSVEKSGMMPIRGLERPRSSIDAFVGP